MLTTLDHIVIAVRDLASATEVYARLLGLRPSWRGAHPLYGTANTLFRLENTYLELLSPTGPGMIAERLVDWLGRRGDGLFALAFGTDDAPAGSPGPRRRRPRASAPIRGRRP